MVYISGGRGGRGAHRRANVISGQKT